jgi:outer membrane scaffolding protein for murein synthesis (MipA/OmpV family)
MHTTRLALTSFALALAGGAHAQTAPTTLDDTAPAASLPLWEVGVIGGGLATPAYPGARERNTRALVLPYVIYRGKVLRAGQGGVDARLFNSDRIELNVGLGASLPADSEDVAIRRGMPDLGTLLEAGPQLKIRLVRPSAASVVRLELPLRSVIEARGGFRNQGAVFEPRVVYDLRGQGWTLSANAGVLFGNKKLNQYFYGVAPQYATAARPAFEADAGRMAWRTQLWLSHDVGRDGRLYGFVRYDDYSGAASRRSPLFQQTHGVSAGLGLAWTLRESSRRAASD